MAKVQEGQVWITKAQLTDKLVGYEVTGVGQEFVSIQALGHDTTRYLTKDLFYAMFEPIGGEDN